ncbi:trypsin-like peptidase domain-containing protein [Pseudarthrobacter sp. J1763]|uniref:S1C family serine protease n=1 Tax=Pseudarthrobacter sp. J1763 TaxID=3420445 RepID=UPI003D2A13A3
MTENPAPRNSGEAADSAANQDPTTHHTEVIPHLENPTMSFDRHPAQANPAQANPAQAGHEQQNTANGNYSPPQPVYPQPAPQGTFSGQQSNFKGPANAGGNATTPPAPHYSPQYGQQPYSQHTSASVATMPGSAPKRKASFGVGTLVACIVAAGLVGGGVAAGGSALWGQNTSSAASTSSQPSTVIVNNKDSVNAITAAAAKASPSVVTISAVSGQSSGTGSGIIIDDQGHILTNTHVVTLDGTAAKATIEVRTNEGKVLTGTVVGTDPLSDLAVIKVDPSGLTPATLGDSSQLNVGDTAVAIGSPLGLTNTVTDGIVSTLNRTISVASSAAPDQSSDSSQGQDDNGFRFAPPGSSQDQSQTATSSIYLNVIQTDAAINPGNSGGALVNSKGEVVGVNVAIASSGSSSSSSSSSGNIGVGFSIPINYAKRIAQDIISNGKATHGQFGVSVQPKTSTSADSTFSVGGLVAEVVSGSAADKAGLKKGDVITKFGDYSISDPKELTAAVREQAAGSTVKVTVQRDGSTKEFDVTLTEAAN